MADQDFSLPIGHDVDTFSTIEIQISKPFLQSVNIPDHETAFTPGLEIWHPSISFWKIIVKDDI